MRYETSRTLPSPRREGYDYITDLKTWEQWSPVSIPDAEAVPFSKEDDVAPFIYRPLGVPVKGTMRLVTLTPGELVQLRFEHRAFMDIDLTLAFENAGAHAFTLTVALEIEDAEWWDRTYEWMSMVPVWLKRDIRRSLESLHRHFMHPMTEAVQAEAS